jgi:hypothetical protein
MELGTKNSKYFITHLSITIGTIIFGIGVLFEVDLFELLVEWLESLEHFEVDEIIIPIFVIICGFLINIFAIKISTEKALLVESLKAEIESKKKHIALRRTNSLKTLMKAVLHVTGNAFNAFELIQLRLNQGSLDQETLKRVKKEIFRAANDLSKLELLEGVKFVKEKKHTKIQIHIDGFVFED